ncbi:MAG TPA: ATP-binding protein [Usitatibacter sp.]|nr:ATP-binding protein [Usitatibacter sp.]
MTRQTDRDEELLRSVALKNASSILRARQQAEKELLQAKEALRDSEERLRATFEQAAVGICVAGLDGKYVQMNRKFCEILGYSEQQLRGMTFADINHPEDVQPTRRLIDDLVAGRIAHYALEKRYLRGDASTIWGRATVTLLRDEQGEPARFIGVIEDISPRKAAENALADETRMLEVLNRTGMTLASSLELQELLQAVTDSATELSGARFGAFFYNTVDEQGEAFQLYTLSGAPRAAFEKFGHPRATPIFAPTFRGEGVLRIHDVLNDPRYGKWGPHHGMPPGHLAVRSYLSVPVRSRSGEVIGGLFFGHPEVGVFTERSERLVAGVAAQAGVAIDNARLYEASRKSAEERKLLLESERHARAAAERASRMKDEFLATLSHELRTPLSAILGWAHLLRSRESPGAEELRKGLETIERNARMQTQLIEDLLDMSRITSGKVRLDIQPVMPATFIEAALETVRPAAEVRGVRLQSLLDSEAGPVSGDPGRLQQVVWNLVSNAIKFTPKGGRVQVLLERINSHIEICVADTGVGIEPEFVEHVFGRFRQADASSTRQFGGLGLGLAIVKQLVELHGGTVRARSEGKDKGSTFVVHLPLLVAKPAGTPVSREHPRTAREVATDFSPVDLAGVRVLVVDDQPDARDLVARILGECHAQVSTAANATEALALVERERPAVIVSDIGMPDVDGYELLRRIRALGAARGGSVPAIALTAFARSEDRTRALHRGFQVHVAKPVEPAELIATVASVAGRTGR